MFFSFSFKHIFSSFIKTRANPCSSSTLSKNKNTKSAPYLKPSTTMKSLFKSWKTISRFLFLIISISIENTCRYNNFINHYIKNELTKSNENIKKR
ncbi:hypothetical protein PFBG_05603 [Plasmodium falciparum 7G8]|uniref:Plasmodium RESA N-terminal domain-containing protein n=1 Tax=Plasmodium falciparum (isolate 7G8) TaxID=57266 RepID=W7ETS1_PLAF8|nr:hypothetical protein PFBG_05603 [Plasmodium falciparum 7G8]